MTELRTPPAEPADRLARLRDRMAAAELGGLLVSAPSSVFYLSGFTGSAGMLLIAADRARLFSDFRYRLQAREQAPVYEFVEVTRSLVKRVGEEARSVSGRLGYDQAHLTCQAREDLAETAAGVELAPAGGMVEELRAVKSPREIAAMEAAAAWADEALAHIVSRMRPGVTERELALEGEFLMRRRGAEAAFKLILASGPQSALPHAETTDRELQSGDLVVIDLGAKQAGYCSDMTRTFAIGDAPEQAREIYRLVYRAQRTALARVRAGAICGDLDKAARDLIDRAGHANDFGHGLGHGVGVDVHEAPRLAREVDTVLAAGNVVTVEPGVYLDGFGGVRLEDMVAVREDRAEVLTRYPMAPELPVV